MLEKGENIDTAAAAQHIQKDERRHQAKQSSKQGKGWNGNT